MNALTHLMAQEWILSGQSLDPDEIAELSEHLAGCEPCRQFAAYHHELLAGVPKVFPTVTHSAGEQRRVTAAVIARLQPRRAANRFFHGTRAVALLFSAAALVVLLAFAIVRLIPSQNPIISGKLDRTPTAASVTPPATSTPAPTQAAINPDAFTSILKVFPLVPGAQWIYTDTEFKMAPNDPTQTIHAVFEITETVVEVRIVGPDYLAHVLTKATPVNVDPAWSSPAPNSDGWSIIHAGKVYGIPADWKYSIPVLPSDLQGIDFGTLYLEYQFPLTDGVRWCPNSLADPAGHTVEPCANDNGGRVVSNAAPFQTAVGSFPTCYLLTDVFYNTGNVLNTFCDGVGIVARKYASASQVPAGFDWEFKSFTAPATAPATPTVTPAPALNLDAFASILKVFPLVPGSEWVYTDTEYDTDPGAPNQIVQAVYEITDTVVDTQISGPSYVVHIQRTVRQISADPGWSRGPTAAGDQWYTIQPNNQVFGKNSNYDGLTLEYQFPLADGERWCPNSETKGSLDPAAPTAQPCLNNIGARIVSSAAPFQSAAGSFPACHLLTDVYNTGNILQTFCDGVGIVARKFDHPGTRFGFSWELKSFTTPAAALTDEQVLARALLNTEQKAFCSWMILGYGTQEIYAWAECELQVFPNSAASVPVVIHLESAGHYGQVEVPGDGTQYAIDVQRLFPPNVQSDILNPNLSKQSLEWGIAQRKSGVFNVPYVSLAFPMDIPGCTWKSEPLMDLPASTTPGLSGWKSVVEAGAGFSLSIPPLWSAQQAGWDCGAGLRASALALQFPANSPYQLTIGFRRPDQAVYITRTGTPAGDFVDAGKVGFFGMDIPASLLVYQGRDMAVFYNGSSEFPAGGNLFTLSLDITSDPKNNESIPLIVQDQTKQILASFQPYPPAAPEPTATPLATQPTAPPLSLLAQR